MRSRCCLPLVRVFVCVCVSPLSLLGNLLFQNKESRLKNTKLVLLFYGFGRPKGDFPSRLFLKSFARATVAGVQESNRLCRRIS
jgi:hypothetical protein